MIGCSDAGRGRSRACWASRRSSRRGRTRGRCAGAASGRRWRGSPRSRGRSRAARGPGRGRGACSGMAARPLDQDWVKGSETWKVVRPGSESKVSDPSWRSTTIRRAVARPRPVPCPGSLVVKNCSKMCPWSAAGMPGPSSEMSTSAQLAVAARGDRDRAVLAERLDRVVDQVRPDLVELGAADGELRQRAVVVAHDLERLVLELVLEDAQGRVDPLVQVDLDELAAVHVGVGLDRLDEVGHLRRRLLRARSRGRAR